MPTAEDRRLTQLELRAIALSLDMKRRPPSGMVTSYLHGVRHHVLVQDLGVDVAQKYDDTAENEQRRWDILALPDDEDQTGIDLEVTEETIERTWTIPM